tara:strand:+ start:114 stop:608 length:495 start_codon:yes stop_codon:yes gene_type:complete
MTNLLYSKIDKRNVMVNKICTKCKVSKSTEEFYKDKSQKDGLGYKCKACLNQYRIVNKERIYQYSKKYYKDNPEYNKKWIQDNPEYGKQYYESFKDGLYHVYILPEENYCGQTDNLQYRKYDHKSVGRNTEGMRVIASFNTRDEALELEALVHDNGYKGRNNGL